jgi:hypothetical protein
MAPYLNESRKIEELIKIAQTLETKDAEKAISLYQEARLLHLTAGEPSRLRGVEQGTPSIVSAFC